MEVIELIGEMQSICEKLRRNGTRIRFVPTMGALHIGHASLIKAANSDEISEHIYDGTATVTREAVDGSGDPLGRQLDLSYSELKLDEQMQMEKSHLTAARILNSNREVDNCLSFRKEIVVVVSIFVNPKQFNDPNDFVNYPQSIETDLEFCRRLNVDYVFAPKTREMYPAFPSSMAATRRQECQCMILPPDKLSDDLEGKSRPGHFKGMLTVVCKLFNIIKPHEAYFGEKDYQQVILVSEMVQDLNMDVDIRPIKTVRDFDSLPLSSRNIKLNERQRKVAPIIYELLNDAKEALEAANGEARKYHDWIHLTLVASLTCLSKNLDDETTSLVDVDYLELRCAKDLSEISLNEDFNGFDCREGCVRQQLEANGEMTLKARLLASIILGDIRLLDNIEVNLNLNN